MPRVHFVKKARRDYEENNIKKGDSYYHWSFRHGGIRRSKTYPKPSQLTQSEFLSAMYDLQEQLHEATTTFSKASGIKSDFDDFISSLQEIAEGVREQGEECSSRRDNMPEQLQDSDSGQLLESRSEQCEEIANELETFVSDVESAIGELNFVSEEEQDKKEILERRDSLAEQSVNWDFE